MPIVSVIVPVYHVEMYLSQCLDSIVNQTLKDIQIILIDNGASETEKSILEFYQKNDSRIATVHFTNNVGYGKAVNYGIQIAKGKYIAIIESDDFVAPEMLECLVNLAEKYDVDIVKSAYFEFDGVSRKRIGDLNIPQDKVFKFEDYPEFLNEHPSIWSCLYKKDFIFSENIKFLESENSVWGDNSFQLVTLYLANKIIYTPAAYYYYRYSREHNSSSLERNINIPYLCILDMLDVIKILNITEPQILYFISKKIVNYINTVVEKITYNNFTEGIKVIQNLSLELNTLNVNNKDLNFYKLLYKRFWTLLFVTKKTISKILKNILYIRLSKKEKYIKFFNYYIYKSFE